VYVQNFAAIRQTVGICIFQYGVHLPDCILKFQVLVKFRINWAWLQTAQAQIFLHSWTDDNLKCYHPDVPRR